MIALLLLFGLSCGFCLLLTPLARALAARWNLVDRPDGRRKIHPRVIPVAGGIAILASVIAALGLAFLVPSNISEELEKQQHLLQGLLLASVVLCVVGVADDLRLLRVRHKILGQLVAVAIVIHFDLYVEQIQLFGWKLELGLLALPFTAFWLLGAINSLNLLDGMDGLLSTVGLIVSLAIAAMAAMQARWGAACLSIAMAGALLGFLRYNFPPASIFLGDSGSMLIGLVIGALAIHCSLKGPATIALAAPMAVLTIPIFDTIAAIIRRKLTGRSLYTTDRGHLHHCLLRRGFSSRRVLLWVSLFCLLTVIGALASLALKNELFAILTALAVIVILIVTQLFGYAEFLLIRKRLTAGFLSFFQGRSNGKAQQLEVRLQGSADWRELWNSLVLCGDQLNLRTIRLDVNAPAIHEGYHARWDSPDAELPSEADPVWRAEIPLAVGGQTLGRLEVTGRRDQESVWMKIATVAKLAESFESAAFTIAFAPDPATPRETVADKGLKTPLPNGLKREQVRTE